MPVKRINMTIAGWVLFTLGYAALTVADRAVGIQSPLFRTLTLALVAASSVLLYKDTRSKGGTGTRVLIVITQLWVIYALGALMFLLLGAD